MAEPVTTSAQITTAQAALADEHAAAWAYGVLGPRAGPRQSLAVATFVQHRDARDRLVVWLRAAGATPVATLAGYRLPFALAVPEDAAALARRLEDGCGNAYASLVGVAQAAPLRGLAAAELASCARRRVLWGGVPQTFPGLPSQK